jgi:RNA polymerase sigma-B factor
MTGVVFENRVKARGATPRGGAQSGREKSARHTALFIRLRCSDDKAALEQLVECFTPLARTLARRYSHTSEPYEDLCQVAQLGLLKAIQRFDPTRGFPFQSFAIPTILGELRRYFRNSSWAVHVPRGVQERALEVREVDRALSEEFGRSPTVSELAQFMELGIEQVLDAMHALRAYSSASLDAPRPGNAHEEDSTYAETIGAEDAHFEMVELGASLASALALLEPAQREMLQMRYLEELTQSQIAQRMGVSQMQVSRLLQRCHAELRELAGAECANVS